MSPRKYVLLALSALFLFQNSYSHAAGTYSSLRVVADCQGGENTDLVRVVYRAATKKLYMQSKQGSQPINEVVKRDGTVEYKTSNSTLSITSNSKTEIQVANLTLGSAASKQNQKFTCETDANFSPVANASIPVQADN